MSHLPFRLLALSLALLATAAPARAEWYEREEAIMGTRVEVQIWATDPDLAGGAIDAVMADNWEIETRDGSVTLRLPTSFNAELDAETRDGRR